MCGDVLLTYPLTTGREVWRCDGCGRRETFEPAEQAKPDDEQYATRDLFEVRHD